MWIEIFRTGKHTDSLGKSRSYSAESLELIASLYNAKIMDGASYEAPVVKGHPKSDEPAYGWVERLSRRGDRLLAKLKNVAPAFLDEAKNGRYRKVSIALYPDMLLRHIGFLGAAPPAVKGLKTACFMDEKTFYEYEAEWLAEAQDNDEEGRDGKQAREEAADAEYAELKAKVRELAAENDALKESNIALDDKAALLAKETRLAEFREFANSLIEGPEGAVITPAQAGDLVDILETAYGVDCAAGEATEYSGGTNVERVKSFARSLRPVLSTGEFAVGVGQMEDGFRDFSESHVSEERLRLHSKACEIKGAAPGLSYEEAVCMAHRKI